MKEAEKTKLALDELRMLMLGSQIFLGFQFQAPFQPAFNALSSAEKFALLAGLCLLFVVIALLIAPGVRHRVVHGGEASENLNVFITRVAALVLAPLALALACDFYVAGERLKGAAMGWWMAGSGAAAALLVWYGPMVFRKADDRPVEAEETTVERKIEFVLNEARVILPGAQALLGFQLIVMFASSFRDLDLDYLIAHAVGLGCVAVSTILLVAPASYHRIVHHGEASDHFLKVASGLVMGATAFLALGLAADAYLAAGKMSDDKTTAAVVAVAAFALFAVLWFVWPLWVRKNKRGQ